MRCSLTSVHLRGVVQQRTSSPAVPVRTTGTRLQHVLFVAWYCNMHIMVTNPPMDYYPNKVGSGLGDAARDAVARVGAHLPFPLTAASSPRLLAVIPTLPVLILVCVFAAARTVDVLAAALTSSAVCVALSATAVHLFVHAGSRSSAGSKNVRLL